jgi:peptidoglycan L-alanyl-D-glutamate endopeptidase CwlK
MSFILSKRSLKALDGVHPDLYAVVRAAIKRSPVDFAVTEGLRNASRQRELYEAGLSKTLDSRHLTGHAVDLCPYIEVKFALHELKAWDDLGAALLDTAAWLGVPLEWGGRWTSFIDRPHFQLPRKDYP